MNESDALARFDAKHRPSQVQPLARRAQFWMSAAIGLPWGVALMEFLTRVWPVLAMSQILAGGVAAGVLGVLAARAPEAWFRLSNPSLTVRRYRALGMVRFRRIMVDGDLMNAEARRLLPGYRLVSPSASDLAAYALRTRAIERGHLIWLAASLPLIVLAALAGHLTWTLAIVVLTVVNNALPVGLQRFNRARCLVLLEKLDARGGSEGPVRPEQRT
jgi:hypothetical protein